MKRLMRWLFGAGHEYRADGLYLCSLMTRAPTVSRAEQLPLVRKQLVEVRRMRRDRTRIDIDGSEERREDARLEAHRLREQRSLEAQRRAQGELKAANGIEDLPRRGGAIIEPLHHHRHAWQRGRSDRFVPRAKDGS